jgi:hypothetical protein
MSAWQGSAAGSFATINQEWTRFVFRRVQEDIALTSQMAQCKSLDDVWRVYAGFMRQAAEDYAAEMNTLAQLGAGATTACVSAAQRGAAKAFEPDRTAPAAPGHD